MRHFDGIPRPKYFLMYVEQINMFFDILSATVGYNFISVYSNTT